MGDYLFPLSVLITYEFINNNGTPRVRKYSRGFIHKNEVWPNCTILLSNLLIKLSQILGYFLGYCDKLWQFSSSSCLKNTFSDSNVTSQPLYVRVVNCKLLK